MAEQPLRLAENLSLPKVEVIVVRANMGCSHCRQRVSKLMSKMNVILDYAVDFHKNEVTLRGVAHETNKISKLTNHRSACFSRR